MTEEITDDYRNDLRDNLALVVEAAQQESITLIVAELMVLLLKNGFTFRNLVEAVADYAFRHPELEPALGHLEEANSALLELLKAARTTP